MCVYREEVYRARNMIYELLEDSYREYIRSVRGRRSSSVAPSARRVSDAVPPDALWGGSAAAANRTLSPTPPAEFSLRPVANAGACESSYSLTSRISVSQAITSSDEDLEKSARQRENSASTMTSSRGSSISSIMDSFKNSDLVSWKKAAKKFKIRRFSNDSS
ncbi:Piso0_005193 [Millerozyma farinosa CBS 7064]|uniref:Piso0_005193 protein n=1 Tax=Pichia sorbitophila (strain ATCC MYA-4447 / BCRC 22081 / CBS 7064 / NBRC 10061 / NRRL Y-12695) TaxID=559304 RepID=G8Y4G5_PICSO|nr:Piso0_005193 [Millerozyma farinosa CBS 7064]